MKQTLSDERKETNHKIPVPIVAVIAGVAGIFGGSQLDLITDRLQGVHDTQIMEHVNNQFTRLNDKLNNVKTQVTLIRERCK